MAEKPRIIETEGKRFRFTPGREGSTIEIDPVVQKQFQLLENLRRKRPNSQQIISIQALLEDILNPPTQTPRNAQSIISPELLAQQPQRKPFRFLQGQSALTR